MVLLGGGIVGQITLVSFMNHLSRLLTRVDMASLMCRQTKVGGNS